MRAVGHVGLRRFAFPWFVVLLAGLELRLPELSPPSLGSSVMASYFVNSHFNAAVQRGDREAWRQILSECRSNLGVCLLDAVRQGCSEAVEDVLRYRPPLNVEDSQGQRPIHLAAQNGSTEIVALLLLAGCTVNAGDREGWTPLHIACRHGNARMVEKLISCRANINAARTEDRLTPLHVAVETGQEDIVQILMRNSADPNIRSSQKHGQVSALTLAVLQKKRGILESFLRSSSTSKKIEYTDVGGNYPLHLAVENGDVHSCHLLLMYLHHMKPLERCQSVTGEKFQEKVTLLEGRENIFTREQIVLNMMNSQGCTALHLAILRNDKEMVEMLLDAGSDTQYITYENMLPFELATKCIQPVDATEILPLHCMNRLARSLVQGVEWDDSLVRLLFQCSINVEDMTKKGDYPIHLVLSATLCDLALTIMELMPDQIYYRNAAGETPLHIACKVGMSDHCGRLQVIRKLLDMGLSVDAVTKDRVCPLSFAVQEGNVEVISTILAWSPDLTIRDVHDFTPLHYAVTCENIDVFEIVLDATPVPIFCDVGPSLLYLAVRERKIELVRRLLRRRVDPNYRDPVNGMSPLHVALSYFVAPSLGNAKDNLNQVDLLLMFGADLSIRNRENLTPLQYLITILLSCSIFPNGKEVANSRGLLVLKALVEAGSRLEPWTQEERGILRRPALQSMAFCGLVPCVYYLANVGWPLETELLSSVSVSGASDNGEHAADRRSWVCLPGTSPDQDNLHAFLMSRNANPFSLMQLTRIAIRRFLTECCVETRGGQLTDIGPLIKQLPVPQVMKVYLNFQDADYSSAQFSWEKLLPLLPSAIVEEVIKLGLTF